MNSTVNRIINVHSGHTTAVINLELDNSIQLESTLKWQELIIDTCPFKTKQNKNYKHWKEENLLTELL